MPLFLLIFFLLYGLFHFYFLHRLRTAFALRRYQLRLLIVFLLLMTVAPLLVRFSERNGFDALAMLLAVNAYVWMGFLFEFTCWGLACEFWRLLCYGLGKLMPAQAAKYRLNARSVFLLPCFVSLVLCVYGYFAALQIHTEKVVIPTAKLPAGSEGVRLVQLSDLHLGLLVGEKRLAAILTAVKAAKPDIIVATGDLIDGEIDNRGYLASLLHEEKSRLGKFAVLGNHEFYAGLDSSLEFLETAGFTVLRNAVDTVPENNIRIVGVDDATARAYTGREKVDEAALLQSAGLENFTILLKHQPVLAPGNDGLFDL